MTTTSTPVMLSAELAAATPTLDEDEQPLALVLYRLLADGQPVEHDALASRAELEATAVADALTRWPGVYLDDTDRIIGLWGLSIQPMPHHLIVNDRVLYACRPLVPEADRLRQAGLDLGPRREHQRLLVGGAQDHQRDLTGADGRSCH